MVVGDLLEVEIHNLDHFGRGIAKVEGKVIFVPNTLINEIVRIQLTDVKKKYMEAIVVSWVKTSEERITPVCPYFVSCGGCDLMHMNHQTQLTWKETMTEEVLKKYVTVPVAIRPIIKAQNTEHYRNKTTFQVRATIGFFEKNSYELVDVDHCFISDERINTVLTAIKEKMELDYIQKITIRASKYTSDLMVILETTGTVQEHKWIQCLKEYCTSLVIKQKGIYKTIYGVGIITEKMKEFIFMISPDSFFQVNTNQAIQLYEKVREYASLTGNESVLDLYCGTGTIGIYLSRAAKKVLGVEVNPYAVLDAVQNKKINRIENIEFIEADVGKRIHLLPGKVDVVVVDPPRSGLDLKTIAYLNQLKTKRLIYVSCDIRTLARDLELLKETYHIHELTPVEMFPHSHHVEIVALLQQK